jgi:hypothetical protein
VKQFEDEAPPIFGWLTENQKIGWLAAAIALVTLYLGYFLKSYWITHLTWGLIAAAVAAIYGYKVVRKWWIADGQIGYAALKWPIMTTLFSAFIAVILFVQA